MGARVKCRRRKIKGTHARTCDIITRHTLLLQGYVGTHRSCVVTSHNYMERNRGCVEPGKAVDRTGCGHIKPWAWTLSTQGTDTYAKGNGLSSP